MNKQYSILRKKAALLCVVAAALSIVCYAQTSGKQRAHSTNAQAPMVAGYLGVGVQDLTDERVKALNLKDNSGVEVSAVAEGAPAEKAGVRLGDVILEVNGQKVSGRQQFAELIAGNAPGTKTTLMVSRNGAKQSIAAVLDSRPADFGPPPGAMEPVSPDELQQMLNAAQGVLAADAPKVGFAGEALGPQLATFFGVEEGVLVQMVYEKTPAEKAGLKAGDIVIKVNGMPVANPREISGIVRQSKKTIVLTVIRNKKVITLNVELALNYSENTGPDEG